MQALTLLNDEAFFEAAGALASRIVEESPSDDLARIDHAFLLCLGRRPTDRETATLKAVLREDRLERGETQPGSTADLAAWTTASRVLLNLDEFITRE